MRKEKNDCRERYDGKEDRKGKKRKGGREKGGK